MAQKRSPGDPMLGKTLGQYTIKKRLGKGGMATVYLADQPSIGRQVAIKVLPRHFMHDETFLARFVQEVKVIANLQHPRVLPVYDYGEIDDRPYIVMAYMAGGTLADIIHKGGMTLEETARYIRQIAEGLDHAHRKGIVHRDFKPSNVLIGEGGDAVLADFGIARVTESTANLTGSGVIGTPAYMAPEMAEHGDVSTLVDIYAMGVTLYEMLSGKAPFKAETPLAVMMAHATQPVPDISLERSDIPKAVADVIRKAMAKRPQDRYATGVDMADALDAAIKGVYAAPAPAATMEIPEVPRSAGSTALDPAVNESGAVAAQSSPHNVMADQTGAQPKRGPGLLGIFGGLSIGLLVGIFACVALVIGGIALAAIGNSSADTNENVSLGGDSGGIAGTSTGAILTVNNSSGQSICSVNMLRTDVGEPQWTDNLLPFGEEIAVGAETAFPGLDAGTYTFRASFCQENTYNYYNFDVGMGAEDNYAFIVEGTASSTLTILNDSSFEACFLYVVAPGAPIRGDQFDLDQTLQPGQQFTLSLPAGTYDMQIETCDGETFWENYSTLIDPSFEWTILD